MLLGFDPGGIGQFGWAVCEYKDTLPLPIVQTGISDHADGAVVAAFQAAGAPGTVCAAGIDAPLFWVASGTRRADEVLRSALRRKGAPSPSGTVQEINSLRGACLVQGILAALLLRRRVPELRVSEAHPKALLWLLAVASSQMHPRQIMLADLRSYITGSAGTSEHERDACLGILSAWAMVSAAGGWSDLLVEETQHILPVPKPLGYWMPLKD